MHEEDETEMGNPAPSRSGRRAWRGWLQVLLAALVLLALSEVLWLWQTWPVRTLLAAQPAAGVAP